MQSTTDGEWTKQSTTRHLKNRFRTGFKTCSYQVRRPVWSWRRRCGGHPEPGGSSPPGGPSRRWSGSTYRRRRRRRQFASRSFLARKFKFYKFTNESKNRYDVEWKNSFGHFFSLEHLADFFCFTSWLNLRKTFSHCLVPEIQKRAFFKLKNTILAPLKPLVTVGKYVLWFADTFLLHKFITSCSNFN